MEVAACIVTYNRLELLKRCVLALKAQTHKPSKIIIVNNDSTDGTSEWIDSQKEVIHFNQPNEGGASGFKKAIELGLTYNFDAVWLMDDDGYPEVNALENLLKNQSLLPAVLNSLVVNEKNTDELVWKVDGKKMLKELNQTVVPGIAHLFNGSLVDIRVVKAVGLPDNKLVIWGDESEYFERIKKSFPVYTISNSYHLHPKAGFSVFKNLDLNFKLIFYFRNRYFIYRQHFGNNIMAFIKYSIFVLQLFTIILLLNDQKLKKLKLLWHAYYSILTKKYISLSQAKAILNEI